MSPRISLPSSQPPSCQQYTQALQLAAAAQLRRQCAISGCRLNSPGSSTTACRFVVASGGGRATAMTRVAACPRAYRNGTSDRQYHRVPVSFHSLRQIEKCGVHTSQTCAYTLYHKGMNSPRRACSARGGRFRGTGGCRLASARHLGPG